MRSLIKKIDLSAASLVLLVLALPLRITVELFGEKANLLIPLYAVIILVSLTALGMVIRNRQLFGNRPTIIDLTLIVFVVLAGLSLTYTYDVREGLIEFGMFYLPFLLMYLSVRILKPGERALKTALTLLFLQGIAFSLFGVYQYLSGHLFWNQRLIEANEFSPVFRVNSIFWDPNMFARFLIVVIVFSMTYLLFRPGVFNSYFLSSVSLICWIGVALSFSRSGWLTLLFALVVLAFLGFEQQSSVKIKYKKVLILLLVVILSALVIFSFVAIRNGDVRTALEGRLKLIRGGFEVFLIHPFTGAGVGSFKSEIRSLSGFRRARVVASHNSTMTMLTEFGLLGFALFLSLIVSALLTIRKAEFLSIAPLACLIALLVHSQFYGAFFEDPYTWWALALLGIVTWGNRSVESKT